MLYSRILTILTFSSNYDNCTYCNIQADLHNKMRLKKCGLLYGFISLTNTFFFNYRQHNCPSQNNTKLNENNKNNNSNKQDNKTKLNNTQMSRTLTSLHLINYCMLKINEIISSSSTMWYFPIKASVSTRPYQIYNIFN